MNFLLDNINAKQSGRTTLIILFSVAAFSFGMLFYFFANTDKRLANLDNLKHATSLLTNSRAFPDFTLTDQNNNKFTNKNLTNTWSFVFFGFTHCPDVCPLTLSTIDKVLNNLTTNNEISAQGVFISVDPKRDTTGELNDYVKHFNQDMIGLTGNDEQLKELTRSLGVVYTTPSENQEGDYLIDHSAHIFLIAPNGNLAAIFSTPHETNTITEDFNILNAYYTLHGS